MLFSGSDRFKLDRARVVVVLYAEGESITLLPHDFRVTVLKS